MYVGLDGAMSQFPAYQTVANWGTVHVYGEGIIPGSTYHVRTIIDGGGESGMGSAVTWTWGDVNDDDVANVTDILLMINGYQGNFSGAPLEALDLMPCMPDRIINLSDIMAAIGAYQDVEYMDTGCSAPCP